MPPKKRNSNNQNLAFIWTRDTRLAGPPRNWFQKRLSDWTDILTGKGPDILVGRLDDLPTRDKWSRWGNHLGKPGCTEQKYNNFLFPAVEPDVVYNFKTRRYELYHREVWSGVEYCQNVQSRQLRSFDDALGFRNSGPTERIEGSCRCGGVSPWISIGK